jgi:hypothetical protein
MNHYEIGDWVDYVRGVVDSVLADAMTRHLNTGCAECSETCEWLGKVARAARSLGPEVPERLVKRAEKIFEPLPPVRFEALFPLIPELLIAAGSGMQAAGVRSSGLCEHSLYRAEGYTVDLQQESARGSATVSLAGQISKDAGELEDRYPVALFSGTRIIAKSISNQFGEFSLAYSRHPELRLAIAIVNTGQKIEIPLTRSTRAKKQPEKEE